VVREIGGPLANRPLHFFWICDCSRSMLYHGKMAALNNAIRETIPYMRDVARRNPHARLLVRTLRFATGAEWHVPNPTPISEFQWSDLQAKGWTHLGKALSMVAHQLEMPPMDRHALPPVLVLISDGRPTDDFDAGLNALLAQPWGRNAVRLAIAIGSEAATAKAQEVFRRFISHPEIGPLQANNPEALVHLIRWASTTALEASTSPPSQIRQPSSPEVNVPIPTLPVPTAGWSSPGDVW